MSVLPFESDNLEKRIAKLHGYMRRAVPQYSQSFCVSKGVRPFKDDITLPIGQIITQWVELATSNQDSAGKPYKRTFLMAYIVRAAPPPVNPVPVVAGKGEKVDKSAVVERERKYFLVGREVNSALLVQLWDRVQTLRRRCADAIGQMQSNTTEELEAEFRACVCEIERMITGLAQPAYSSPASEHIPESVRGRTTPSVHGIVQSETHASVASLSSLSTKSLPVLESFLNPRGGVEAIDEAVSNWLASVWALAV